MNALLAGILVAALTAPLPTGPSEGDLAFQDGDFDAAFLAYNTALTASPNDANANLGIGTLDLYRNDLKNARTYLSRAVQLNPQNTVARIRLGTVRRRLPANDNFQISMDSPAVIPFISADPLPTIRATVNGKPLTLFVDTGGASLDLGPDTAQRLGIAAQDEGEGIFAGGKTAPIKIARIDTVSLEGLTVHGVPGSVLAAPINIAGHHADGAIGTSFLYHFLSTIDYAGRRLVLRPKVSSALFEAQSAKSGATIVPMWLIGDHFIFARARVNDAKPALFNIDTGGAGVGVQLTRAELDASSIMPDETHPQQFTGAAGPVQVLPFTAQTVTLGNFVQQNVPGFYSQEGDQYRIFPFAVGGTLSHEFFRSTQLTMDFSSMKLIVARVEPPAGTKPHGNDTRRTQR